MSTLYDRIGRSYHATRKPDPRIAVLILDALGDARSVLNVGAGTGSYEPTDREVLAVEPSATMIAQRPPGAAPVIQASAEELPLPDKSYDAALAINTIHHWHDVPRALAELRRVVRQRIVVFMNDMWQDEEFWLVERYFPQFRAEADELSEIRAMLEQDLGPLREVSVALPADCTDGLLSGYWARPEAYLDATVRANISPFTRLSEQEVAAGVERLAADLASGEWDRRYGHLRKLRELHLGHRILVAELS
ncbi:MAG: class I SAM-dependent methyltransferase [Actinomycetota bacterium]|nr:class I SAM-dependent methyltransferase [Actinomycetota bacterium]